MKVRFEWFGIIGSTFIGACCAISAAGFTGFEHEGFSILNHEISELGMALESPVWWVFSIGLIIGTPLMLIFILYVHTLLPSPIGFAGTVIGIVAAAGGFLVGIFPADKALSVHDIVAVIFFVGGAVAVILLSIAIDRQKNIRVDKWLCIIGIVVAACFTIYLVDQLFFSTGPALTDPNSFAGYAPMRPAFWADAFLEWLPLISILAWMFCAAIVSLKRNAA